MINFLDYLKFQDTLMVLLEHRMWIKLTKIMNEQKFSNSDLDLELEEKLKEIITLLDRDVFFTWLSIIWGILIVYFYNNSQDYLIFITEIAKGKILEHTPLWGGLTRLAYQQLAQLPFTDREIFLERFLVIYVCFNNLIFWLNILFLIKWGMKMMWYFFKLFEGDLSTFYKKGEFNFASLNYLPGEYYQVYISWAFGAVMTNISIYFLAGLLSHSIG